MRFVLAVVLLIVCGCSEPETKQPETKQPFKVSPVLSHHELTWAYGEGYSGKGGMEIVEYWNKEHGHHFRVYAGDPVIDTEWRIRKLIDELEKQPL